MSQCGVRRAIVSIISFGDSCLSSLYNKLFFFYSHTLIGTAHFIYHSVLVGSFTT